MSDVKKVLTLVACGCICLMLATSVSADYTGVKAVNKGGADTQHDIDIDFLCTQANGDFVLGPLTVCNVYAMFDDPDDRLLSVGNSNMQVYNGPATDVFFQHGFNFFPILPPCAAIQIFPDLICDTFVTIGPKCACAAPCVPGTSTDGDFQGGEFEFNGHVVGGWYNADPFNGEGDAGTYPDLQVLFFQSSVAQGLSMSGDTDIFWRDPDTGETNAELDVAVECLAKCEPGPCDDSDACTGPDPNDPNNGPCPEDTLCDDCVDGVCTGPPVNCDDGNDCTDDSCDPATGCVHTDNNDPCDDGDFCTDGDACSGGSCQGGGPTDCDDSDACTDDGCNSDTGCTHSDVDCNDNNACTDDGCNPATGCTHEGINCDDGDCCTDDGCDPASGCTHDQVPCPPGDACNSASCMCEEIPCETDADCDDGDNCTTDVCTPNGCTNDPVTCQDDGNECTDTACDPATGDCVTTNNNNPCDDGDACTENDACSGGSCSGSDVDCDDDDACTDDDCDSGSGCTHEDNSGDCDDGNACTDDSCDPATGCVNTDNNDSCDDGTACTDGDTCSGGSCSGDPLPPCPKGEVCDPDTGDCVLAPSGTLDIIPGKCPNRLREHGLGWLKVSLVSSDIPGEEFDACDVDVATLLLVNDNGCGTGVAPRMSPRPRCRDRATPFLGELCDCHSRRKDGLPDLDMKFKLSELRAALCLNLPAGTISTLCLTGLTSDGMPIRACDCVISDRPGDGTPGPGGG